MLFMKRKILLYDVLKAFGHLITLLNGPSHIAHLHAKIYLHNALHITQLKLDNTDCSCQIPCSQYSPADTTS